MLEAFAQAGHGVAVRLTEAALGRGRSGRRLDDLARRLQREFDQAVEKAFAALPGQGVACAPGCDHCCRTLRVSVSPVEIFALVHRLQEARVSDRALDERLTRLAQETSGPCPLLDEGVCVLYSSRPLACRGCVSADAALCAACDDDRPVPRSMLHQLGAAALMRGCSDTLREFGLAGDPTDLRSGLAIALADDNVEKRWLRGERVFPEYSAR